MGNIYVTKNAIVVYLESLMISYPGQNSIKMESDGLDHTNSRPLALQTVFSYWKSFTWWSFIGIFHAEPKIDTMNTVLN